MVLSAYAEPSYALALLDRGTGRRAYLLKDRIRNSEELIEAIEAVARGGSAIDPIIVDVLIQARLRAANSQLSELTAKSVKCSQKSRRARATARSPTPWF